VTLGIYHLGVQTPASFSSACQCNRDTGCAILELSVDGLAQHLNFHLTCPLTRHRDLTQLLPFADYSPWQDRSTFDLWCNLLRIRSFAMSCSSPFLKIPHVNLLSGTAKYSEVMRSYEVWDFLFFSSPVGILRSLWSARTTLMTGPTGGRCAKSLIRDLYADPPLFNIHDCPRRG